MLPAELKQAGYTTHMVLGYIISLLVEQQNAHMYSVHVYRRTRTNTETQHPNTPPVEPDDGPDESVYPKGKRQKKEEHHHRVDTGGGGGVKSEHKLHVADSS